MPVCAALIFSVVAVLYFWQALNNSIENINVTTDLLASPLRQRQEENTPEKHTEHTEDSYRPEKHGHTELPKDIPKVTENKNQDQETIQKLNQHPIFFFGPTKHINDRVDAFSAR